MQKATETMSTQVGGTSVVKLCVLMFGLTLAGYSFAAPNDRVTDLEIVSIEIFYKDDVTVPGKITKRRLMTFSDTPFWSKPSKVDVVVSVRNKSNKPSSAVISPSLFYLLSADPEVNYPPLITTDPMGKELKEVSKDAGVWVWNRVLLSKGLKSIAPGEVVKVTMEGLDISSEYSPVDYRMEAFSIRVYVDSYVQKDIDYSNNVKEAIIEFPM
jgi:hypothetical protein